ncbi:MAG TPA: DMT family transporter [Candidatus Polarisedimenticolia bacterium]|nr:DMT family transporter [Candidatus Polarisedimenticolia bacterium]
MQAHPLSPANSRATSGLALALLAAFGAMFFWGLNYSFAKMTVEELDPLAVALVRVVVATPLLFLALARSGRAGFSLADLRRTLPLGLSGVLANQVFFITGIQRTTPAHSSLVVALLPIVVLLLAHLKLGERFTPMKLGGMSVALAGIVLISLRDGWSFSRETLLGDLLTFCGVCSFAYYTVAGKGVIPGMGVLRTTALSFLTGGLAMLPLALPSALKQDWGAISPRAWLGLAYVVLVGTFLCYLLYYWALSRVESGKVAAFMYLQPVVAGITSYLLLGETLRGHFLLGGMAVLAGVFLAERG